MTKKEIIEATTELQNALLEFIELSAKEDELKIAKQKAQKRLSMARDQVRSLKIDY